MGRLIDTDILIGAIRKHQGNVGENDLAYQLAHEHIIDVVNSVPTAYDIEKVKEQLKGQLKENTNSRISLGSNVAIFIAMEIVEAGGTDG